MPAQKYFLLYAHLLFFFFQPFAFVAASPDDADRDALPEMELEETEVVASPIIKGNRTDRFAGQKTTVSRAQITGLNAQDLSSALRTTPGVNITRYNVIGSFGGGSGGAVFIRGAGSSRPGGEVATLINGVPVSTPTGLDGRREGPTAISPTGGSVASGAPFSGALTGRTGAGS